jgi:hypothetical protein
VFDSGALRTEVTGDWKKERKKERKKEKEKKNFTKILIVSNLHKILMRLVKSGFMILGKQLPHMDRIINAYKMCVRHPEGTTPSETCKLVAKLTSRCRVMTWTCIIWPRIRPRGRHNLPLIPNQQ